MLSKADRLMENIYISKLARYYIEEDAEWKGKTPHFSASRPRYLPSYIHWPPERLDCRLKESCPDNRTRDGRFLPRGHKLFLGAYHIAARQLEDDHYGKDTWNVASAGSVTAKYLQAFERRVSRHFRYQVNFSKEVVIDFVFALWLKYGNTVLTETRLAVAEAAQRQRNKVARHASQNAAKALSVHPQSHLCPLAVERAAPQSLADSVAPLVPVAQGPSQAQFVVPSTSRASNPSLSSTHQGALAWSAGNPPPGCSFVPMPDGRPALHTPHSMAKRDKDGVHQYVQRTESTYVRPAPYVHGHPQRLHPHLDAVPPPAFQ
ncbi:predicted protein [Postia placenta Mad-698-R]|uniref:Uncharacterized protein n=1 Tax=Postia placenta MAD-698-R-SB12 TaxID=670580 RepID=A0A1X6MW86_9APHY|nr:hypothetical protein POSPLADRAFT_1147307 [Postia placenta MAD-698-R-SB12]EED84392.1 predicted protein [Postia placenta Mad-698-R]OSX60627.1 hypothetical protein POSPLADRAFT_1147307 [Postia placenta MAD-698-R-SB12]